MIIFAPLLKLKPFQLILIALSIVLMIPLSLMLLVLIPFVIQSLIGTPSNVLWNELLGTQLSTFIAPFFDGTQFEQGIPLSFQKEYFALMIMGSAFLYAFLSFVNEYLLRRYGEYIEQNLRTKIATKFLSLPFQAMIKLDAGFLSAIVSSDANETQRAFVRLIMGVLRYGLISIVLIVWLIFLDYHLFILIITIAIPVLLVLIKIGRILKKSSKEGIQLESDLLSGLLERMRGWQTIQIYKAVPFEIAKFNKLNQMVFNTWRRATRAKALGAPLIEFCGIIAGVLIVLIAIRRVYGGELTTSVLISFMVTIGILSDKIKEMIEKINTSKRGIESFRRISNFLTADLGVRNPVKLDIKQETNIEKISSLEISNLSIENLDQRMLIEQLSGIFKPGSFTVLIGPSGIGKTTFLNVILGLLNQTKGKIFVNNATQSEEVYLKYASQIGFVPQDPYLFHGTVLDNITYPQKIINCSEELKQKAEKALINANLKLDLTADVFGLSGGEKQRIMFARLFFNEPSLVIIDEGTSALDAFNENNILQTLRITLDSSIIFMVSHRVSVKKFATDIIDFSKYHNID